MRLRASGIRISVDDFGTGHSSLASLRQYPVDSLKVDRSFVRGIETRADMGQILGTVTTMARQLGLQVVVEGIENEAQAALVQSLQCEYGQGYLFSKPLAHDRATILLETGLPPRRASAAGTATAPVPPELPAYGTPRDTGGRQRLSRLLYAVAALVLVSSLALVARFTQAMRLPPSSGAAVMPAPAPSLPPAVPVTSSVAAKPAAVKRAPAALRVVHQHRLGSCRGLLTVSRGGVAFAPDQASEARDAFSFKYGQFVHDLTSEELTIKSSARTYRFKSAVVGAEDNGEDLPALVDSMARLR